MNGRLGPLSILPSQMLMLNPLLVISLVPIFETCVYPLLARFHCLTRPLRRMGWGGFWIASSFVMASLVQVFVDQTYTPTPADQEFFYHIKNRGQCDVKIFDNLQQVEQGFVWKMQDFSGNLPKTLKIQEQNCPEGKNTLTFDFHDGKQLHEKGVFVQLMNETIQVSRFNLTRTTRGRSYIMFNVQKSIDNNQYPQDSYVSGKLINQKNGHVLTSVSFTGTHATMPVDPPIWDLENRYDFTVEFCTNSSTVPDCRLVFQSHYVIVSGQNHIFISSFILENETSTSMVAPLFEPVILGNNICMMWQLPQFLLITIGEIMFCVTGLEFSYSQAATRLKSVVLALWYVNNAFGDMVPTVVSFGELFRNQPAWEFLMYALLVYVSTAVFSLVALKYEYVEHDVVSGSPEPTVTLTPEEEDDLADQHNAKYIVSTL